MKWVTEWSVFLIFCNNGVSELAPKGGMLVKMAAAWRKNKTVSYMGIT